MKALIASREETPRDSHDLRQLCNEASRLWQDDFAFLRSRRCDIILECYLPFYEVPRYPVARRGPERGWVFQIPDGVVLLDYFVHEMRTVLSVPENTWDIFRNGHFDLHFACNQFPELAELFRAGNLNFAAEDVS